MLLPLYFRDMRRHAAGKICCRATLIFADAPDISRRRHASVAAAATLMLPLAAIAFRWHGY